MPDKRYALVIDAKKCINCKACVVACRAENRVPLGYSRDWIGEEHRVNGFMECGTFLLALGNLAVRKVLVHELFPAGHFFIAPNEF